MKSFIISGQRTGSHYLKYLLSQRNKAISINGEILHRRNSQLVIGDYLDKPDTLFLIKFSDINHPKFQYVFDIIMNGDFQRNLIIRENTLEIFLSVMIAETLNKYTHRHNPSEEPIYVDLDLAERFTELVMRNHNESKIFADSGLFNVYNYDDFSFDPVEDLRNMFNTEIIYEMDTIKFPYDKYDFIENYDELCMVFEHYSKKYINCTWGIL